MDEKDLRDCFAMFAIAGYALRGDIPHEDIAYRAYDLADIALEARNKRPEGVEGGIAAVVKQWDEPFVAQPEDKPKRKRVNK